MDHTSILPLLQTKLKRAKSASRGASISLVNDCNGFLALLEDAKAIRKVVGKEVGKWTEMGEEDELFGDSVPQLHIPYADMPGVMAKMAGHHSVALLEFTTDRMGTHMTCFYVQPRGTPAVAPAKKASCDDLFGDEPTTKKTENCDDLF